MPSFSKIIVAALALGVAQAFSTPRSRATTRMTLESYKAELAKTAKSIASKGKGLLACDESTGTVGTRLEANGLENTEKNRQIWRNLLFTTEGIGEYISGAILFEETLFQNDPEGKPFVDVLKAANIIPGIKVTWA